MLPVTEGTRVTLTFLLRRAAGDKATIRAPPAAAAHPLLAAVDRVVVAAQGEKEEEEDEECSRRRLGIFLRHKYAASKSAGGLQAAALKGRDAVVHALLAQSSKVRRCRLTLSSPR